MTETRIAIASPDEAPFILDTWARSLRKAPQNRRMPTRAFHLWNRPRMIDALKRSTVYVAVAEDEPAYVLGWIAVEEQPHAFIAHYCYVRPLYQRQGIASRLLRHAVQKHGGNAHEAVYTNRAMRFVDEYMARAGFSYNPHATR